MRCLVLHLLAMFVTNLFKPRGCDRAPDRHQVRSLRTIVMGGTVPTRTLLEAAMTYLCKDIVCQCGATEIGLIARAMVMPWCATC